MGAYAAAHQRSITDPSRFWGLAARDIRWLAPPDRVLDDGAPPFYRWFTGGELNTCENALDRHVEEGHGGRPALIDGDRRAYTYAELRDVVARCAGALRALGVERGDRVLVRLPLVAEAAIALLACARLGAVPAVVGDAGLTPEGLAARIDGTRPKVVVSAAEDAADLGSGTRKPLLDSALRLASHTIGHRMIWRRDASRTDTATSPPRDVDWDEALASASPAACVTVAATDPLHILFTPGTGGPPKGVVRDNGGFAVALRWAMENVYGVGPGDAIGVGSDVGWAVGLSSAVYGPLVTGCTVVLCPGGADPWRPAAEHRVRRLITTSAGLRAQCARDPAGTFLRDHDLSALQGLIAAGEAVDEATFAWASRVLGLRVSGEWGQAETGRAIAANPLGLEPMRVTAGSSGVPTPGFDVRVLNERGGPVGEGGHGELAIRLPLPPGALSTLWREDERFVESYLTRHPGHYLTGDVGRIDADGQVRVTGRAGEGG
ncbi:AMP-binding protein [Thermomonospora umbrina]|uniref:Propionyl-CoA synthetase n=1 Tax=Thermomonospora umbrina TaxID=111806 RepID=A0A3D9T8S8_9ACTN|nr:AMP-binding protein [Thermomonospora umbrina]REF01065.1 propionyl-CoA synthetase [Thermomonospora umbrina]